MKIILINLYLASTPLNIHTETMKKLDRYHITKTEEGWKGKKQGGTRASVTGQTKQDVVKKTIDIAKNKRNSSVLIHKSDGKIQEERI